MLDNRPLAAIALLLLLLGIPAEGRAADVKRTTQEIIQALTPRPGHPHLRGVELDLPKPETQPSVSFHVVFAHDSAVLTEDAAQTVDRIGEALTSDALKSSRFLVAGHTDATGTPAHNMALSLERAKSVASRLTAKFAIPPERLDVQGFGASRPLDPQHPSSETNRRVQIVNLGPTP